ncbi:putative WRKY transcription factor 35 [Hordeum vulgare]|nr:putative WRKY transcription factor 35 [Hordeum vulgare]
MLPREKRLHSTVIVRSGRPDLRVSSEALPTTSNRQGPTQCPPALSPQGDAFRKVMASRTPPPPTRVRVFTPEAVRFCVVSRSRVGPSVDLAFSIEIFVSPVGLAHVYW